jgi:hypothetical protein
VKAWQKDGTVMTVPVHSFLLKQSEYFDAMMSHPFKEMGEAMFEVQEADHVAVNQMIKHLYEIRFDFTDASEAWNLLELANYLQIAGLDMSLTCKTHSTRWSTTGFHNKSMPWS